MSEKITAFFAELRIKCGPVKEFEDMELLCVRLKDDPSVAEYLQTFAVIAGSDRTLREKVEALRRLCATPGGVGRA
jgi:hypothetical protein